MQDAQQPHRVEVVVLGSANMDLTLRVDALPAPGETVLGGEPDSRPGGKGANQAVAAARAGAQVAFIGCVGADAEGTALAADLRREGVSTAQVRTSSGHRTGLAVVLVGPNGENQIAVSPGANYQLRGSDVDEARSVIAAAGVLLVQLEVPLEVVRHALVIASECGTTVVLNLSPARLVDAQLLELVDVLIVNRAEAAFLLDSPMPDGMPLRDGPDGMALRDMAERLRQRGPAAVVVTAGSAGAVCVAADEIMSVDALPVRVLDTTGAGDAFAGALAAELSHGNSLKSALGVANAAGAAAVGRHGAR